MTRPALVDGHRLLEVLDRETAAVLLSPSIQAVISAAPELSERLDALRDAGVRVCELGAPHRVQEALGDLGGAGIGPGLVLVLGARSVSNAGAPGDDGASLAPCAASCLVMAVDEAMACKVLDVVLERRRQRRVPDLDADPAWVISENGNDPHRQRASEAVLTIGAGGIGTRGSVEEEPYGAAPLVVAAGVYVGSGSMQHLLPLPGWTRLDSVGALSRDLRQLDLRTGVLFRTQQDAVPHPLRTARFASATLPGAMLLRAEGSTQALQPGSALSGKAGDAAVVFAGGAGSSGVAVAAHQQLHDGGEARCLERIAAYVPMNRADAAGHAAGALLARAEAAGFDRLLAAHRAEWAGRWRDTDVRILDDPQTQLAVRYALFQLWSQTANSGEFAMGARGISGPAYSGHVFWDADAFVLPALASIHPAAALAMVRYRSHRLGAARAAAAALGRRGARFPWESAADGGDVTPVSGRLGEEVVAIRTGQQEEHITADVAWGAAFCAEWSGTRILRDSHSSRLLVDTARYWQSRCRFDAQGAAHIDGVIGPDEYHENVDDNAYTNVMARWNLRHAAQLLGPDALDGEARAWRRTADALVDGLDPGTGRYEQFAGYHNLEPLTVADLGTVPVAADLLLGSHRVAGSQLIKQPDVLMLHHLVPDEAAPGSLAANLAFYDPRTAHGSSLSPAVTAALLARAGRPDDALQMLQIALSLDLADRTGTTAGGLHLATLAGVWRCMLAGFGGIRVRAGRLLLDPILPAGWGSLDLRFRALGRRLRIHIERSEATVHSDGPLEVQTPDGRITPSDPTGLISAPVGVTELTDGRN
jgi:trehalose/maltose hydrolase-like predicted phosphorylase